MNAIIETFEADLLVWGDVYQMKIKRVGNATKNIELTNNLVLTITFKKARRISEKMIAAEVSIASLKDVGKPRTVKKMNTYRELTKFVGAALHVLAVTKRIRFRDTTPFNMYRRNAVPNTAHTVCAMFYEHISELKSMFDLSVSATDYGYMVRLPNDIRFHMIADSSYTSGGWTEAAIYSSTDRNIDHVSSFQTYDELIGYATHVLQMFL